jgi:hypothetical protein
MRQAGRYMKEYCDLRAKVRSSSSKNLALVSNKGAAERLSTQPSSLPTALIVEPLSSPQYAGRNGHYSQTAKACGRVDCARILKNNSHLSTPSADSPI